MQKRKKPVLKKKLTMSVGESKTLKVKNTKKKVKWSSSKKVLQAFQKGRGKKAKKKERQLLRQRLLRKN